MPVTQGSSCRSNRVFKLYEGVTNKQTYSLHKPEQLVLKPAANKKQFKESQVSVTLIQCYQGSRPAHYGSIATEDTQQIKKALIAL